MPRKLEPRVKEVSRITVLCHSFSVSFPLALVTQVAMNWSSVQIFLSASIKDLLLLSTLSSDGHRYMAMSKSSVYIVVSEDKWPNCVYYFTADLGIPRQSALFLNVF